jgi:transcription initiation factor TFIIE subunit alpha
VQELDTKGYVCPQCKKTFLTLEADRLMDFTTMTFRCDVCSHELVDNEDADAVRGSRDRMERFNHQMRYIIAGLRASEEMVMPHFDVNAHVKQQLLQTEADRQEKLGGAPGTAMAGPSGRTGDGELRIAGTGSTTKDEGIGIVMSGGVDEDLVRAERDKAAEAKKAQNALPAWHLQSTISGDLTALGVAEQAKAAAAEAQRAAAASAGSDHALRGLGTVGGRLPDVKMESMISMSDDVKPNIETTSVGQYFVDSVARTQLTRYIVDDYYAGLTVNTQSNSTPTSGVPDDFGEEEEDVKPDVSQLMHTSLNDYRKRARSPEPDHGASKLARLEEPAAPPAVPEPDDMFGDDEAPAEDDPIVYGL